MAGSVNKVVLIGNLGRDPTVRRFQNGGMVATLSIATSESWRDRSSGDRRERTEWHTVSILNEGTAKIAEQYLRKGSKVYIEGALETRKWQDQSGADRYTTEVVIRPYRGTIKLLDGKRSEGGEGYSRGGRPGMTSRPSRAPGRVPLGPIRSTTKCRSDGRHSMSRMRIAAKVRKNADYQAIERFLGQIGFSHQIHPPAGKGHPFIRIGLPCGRELDFHIACTPAGRCNTDARVARLRRHLADAGYRFE